MFSLKTILTTLIGTGFASSLVALRTIQAPAFEAGVTSLPVGANEDNLVKPVNKELILSQIDYGSNRYDNEPSDSLKNVVGLGVLAIGTGVIGYHVSRAYKPSLVNSLPTINSSSSATLLARVSPKLRQELLRLVHNQQTANRLMNGTSNSHPGRSANWIAEKVIYDLKRDR